MSHVRKYLSAITFVAFAMFMVFLFARQEANTRDDLQRKREQSVLGCERGNARSQALRDLVDFASKPLDPTLSEGIADPKTKAIVEESVRRNTEFREYALGSDPETGKSRIPIADCQKDFPPIN